jgi:hypothetical protein
MAISKSINYLYVFKSFVILARVLSIIIMAIIIIIIIKVNILALLFQNKGKDLYNKPSTANICL